MLSVQMKKVHSDWTAAGVDLLWGSQASHISWCPQSCSTPCTRRVFVLLATEPLSISIVL